MPSSLYHCPAEKPTRDPSHLCCQIQACLLSIQVLQKNQPPVCSPLHGSSAVAKPSYLPFFTLTKTFSASEPVIIAFLFQGWTLEFSQSTLFTSPRTSQGQTPSEPILPSPIISWTAGHLKTDVFLHPQETLKQLASCSAHGMGLIHVGSLTT